ncbi:hypothetical protein [Klebsiella pneumoniae]|uniref:hypothetical protein n=1 Tax=Klebsiella pneumoniae TaxID=573 RepID=UPI00215B2DF4
MTSKLTREQLHERARENVKALKMASRQTAFESAREEILADLQLAELVLAAMDGEPVAWTWHYREQWHVTNDERRAEFVAKDGDVAVLPLYRHAQPALTSESITVTDDMAYAFHHALTDSMIGADDVEEIKTGLRAVFANLTAPVVSAEYPDRLPCSVLLEPGLRFGKGIKTSTMLAALARRAVHESDMAALSPEERAEFQAGIEEFKSLIAQPAPVVPEENHIGSKNALDAIVSFIKSKINPTVKCYEEVSEQLFKDNCHGIHSHVIEYILKLGEELEDLRAEQAEMQPAPVVPDDVLDALQKVARIRLDMNDFDGDRRGIADCLGDAEEALIEVVNRRAAMLAAAPQPQNAPQNIPEIIPDCWCRACRPVVLNDMRFVVCPDCGNKRCPRANDHRNACTGSNEPGQEGSAYPDTPREVK